MPDANADHPLELAAQRVRQLEQQALDMHDRAQLLNKEGRFTEAQEAYAAMHRLEDEASELAATVGCVVCVLGDAPQQDASAEPSLCTTDPAVFKPYYQLQPALPWPTAATAAPTTTATVPTAAGGLPEAALRGRAVGCVLGSALADAAAMGVHWMYDLGALEELAAERRPQEAGREEEAGSPGPHTGLRREHPYGWGLEFMDPPRSPFYAYASGRNSPYGEQTLALLRSLADQGGLHGGAYADTFAAVFGPDSGFDGYRDVSTKGFLRNHVRGMPPPLSGANDAQANCIARLAPLAAAFAAPAPPGPAPAPSASSAIPVPRDGADAGGPAAGLLRCVELATRVTQNTDAAVAWACVGAAVLERMLLGGSALAAVEQTLAELEGPQGRLAPHCGPLAPELAGHLRRVLQLRTTPVPEAVAELGRNCHMPNALQTPLLVVLYVEHLAAGQSGGGSGGDAGGRGEGVVLRGGGSGGGDVVQAAVLPAEAFVWGVRLAVREGGCCASRAAYVGACLGALTAGGGVGGAGGGEDLPARWVAKYTAAEQVRSWALQICEARSRASGGSVA
ncbi:Crystallin J1A [Tetrabaena socialis]|uniref:Crystallin J1A n=1 Tax=Tetrabaena socialis TaxID=47790 RepID=A0A2J8AID9_9CHLO|nr:Crystallin J1A [Tetrabaena socialis]|eukprot:PNH12277.1 Crystallin J1A [Tetrabaena socialis]